MTTRPWSISKKFILFVSGAVALFMISAFLLTRTMLEGFALDSAGRTAELVLDRTDKRLVAFFSELEAQARSLAYTGAVRRVDATAMRDLFVASVLPRREYLRAVYLGTADGRMYEWGVGAEFVDYTPSFPPDYDPRVRPWYRGAMEKADFSVSAPYRYASVDDIGITCALPVRLEDGSLVGVLGQDILLSSLGGVLEGLEIPNGGKALILGPSGEILASQYPGDGPEGFILKRFSHGDVVTDNAGRYQGAIAGIDSQFVYRRILSLDWILVITMPLEPIRASVRALLDLIGLVELLLMAALVAALAGISGKLIVTPLGRIVSVINKVEGGQKGARVSVDTTDEFGFLGGEFNRLLDAVEEYSSNLEDKVRTRTEELGRLQRENTRLRVIEERRRIYRDMHDAIGAKLTNIFFCNSVARDLAKDGPERLRQVLESAESNCLQAVSSLKGIILGMSEDDRRANSFSLAVSAGVRARLEAGGISFDCVIRDKRAIEALPSATLGELEKLMDELVSNVLKHSGASVVRLRISCRGAELRIRFSDDGHGFDARATGPGSGLGNIRYRVNSLGGGLSLKSAPGRGAAYDISVPLARSGAAAC